jgi:hypothetical protein
MPLRCAPGYNSERANKLNCITGTRGNAVKKAIEKVAVDLTSSRPDQSQGNISLAHLDFSRLRDWSQDQSPPNHHLSMFVLRSAAITCSKCSGTRTSRTTRRCPSTRTGPRAGHIPSTTSSSTTA